MKLILLLFTLLLATPANAQYESVFGEQETSWNLLMASNEFIDLTFTSRTQTSTTTEDTIVNGEVFKRYIYTTDNGIFKYEMKEDTAVGKVWMGTLSIDDTMYLKFDLSLNVGDTFYFHNPIDTGIVQNIYLQNGKKHIEFDINHHLTGEPIKFIEGVGPTTGFVDWVIYDPPLDYIGYVVCQKKNSNTSYTNSISNDCSLSFSSLNEITLGKSIHIYPNPILSGNKFNIQSTKDIQKNDVKIFDAIGKQVCDYTFTRLKKESYEIELSSIESGNFIIQIQTSEGVSTKKLTIL